MNNRAIKVYFFLAPSVLTHAQLWTFGIPLANSVFWPALSYSNGNDDICKFLQPPQVKIFFKSLAEASVAKEDFFRSSLRSSKISIKIPFLKLRQRKISS